MNNIGFMLKQRSVVSPDLEAYVEPSTSVRVTYEELNTMVNRYATVLQASGIQKGERMGLLLPNSVEFVALFYAAAKLGVVVVPLNNRLTAYELEFILSNSGTKLLFYGADYAETAAQVKSGTEHPCTITRWVQVGGADDSLAQRVAVASDDEPLCNSGDTDNLFIMYTSGTTGQPKGVVHSHNSVACAANSWASTLDVRYQDRILLPLPMFHVAALSCVVFSSQRGLTIVSMPNFDPVEIWTLIVAERVNVSGAVPAILNFMRQAPQFAELDAPDFRCFVTGAAPMPKALIEIYAAKNMQVVQGYALTETCGGGSFLMNDDALRKIGSAGKAGMFIEIKLRDSEGNFLDRGEGEVVIKSDSLMKEYWNRPDATEGAFENGWFRTGDVADIDEEGFIYIKDRIKDMIISGGENIYPAEVENAVMSHPAVTEAAVIGLPDDKWGEIACAIVVGDRDQADEDAIINFCMSRLSRFKLPKKVIFADEIPRNPSGKVLKRVLREKYAKPLC